MYVYLHSVKVEGIAIGTAQFSGHPTLGPTKLNVKRRIM